jgi:hypothetical protein
VTGSTRYAELMARFLFMRRIVGDRYPAPCEVYILGENAWERQARNGCYCPWSSLLDRHSLLPPKPPASSLTSANIGLLRIIAARLLYTPSAQRA